jgi:hypothetical protein
MKIITPGTKPEIKRAWWLDVELLCHRCGCVFQLEEGDEKRSDVNIAQARCIDCVGVIAATCPTCGALARYEGRPSQRIGSLTRKAAI